jgi:1,4-alpha-glucan branching enzyme
MISQDHIDPTTPMGATLIAGGATFRVWAPRAVQVYVNGTFGGEPCWDQSSDQLMARNANGCWTGFVAGARDGDPYKFYVVGTGGRGYKRDPDAGFRTPDFADMIVYQLHVGTYAASAGKPSKFLDVVDKLDYLVALGVNVLQPLPIDEVETAPSKGYNGSDYFSPDLPYVVPASALAPYLATLNRLLAAKGAPPLAISQLASGPNQLKAMIDLCHLYGIAVVLDVVYNHAGGFQGDDESLYFWDRAPNGDNNNSLYFTDQGWAGGLSFALWNRDVREFLIDSARYYIEELHVDGFRYDEVSALVNLNGESGWSFCQDITSTVRFIAPRVIQNAEFWPVNPVVVRRVDEGGAGFDVLQHDGLRDSVRTAIEQCSYGASASVDLDAIARQLYPPSLAHAWQALTCVENHDLVKEGAGERIPALADGSSHRSWFARSRARVATALLLSAPGIPMLFMGQEFLEDKPWSDDPRSADLLDWPGLASGDKAMVDHLRFTQDAIRLRREQPALRGDALRVFHVHNGNRVIAFHRWIEGVGEDVVVIASLNDATLYGYRIGFPRAGRWREAFNTDVYDHWVNPQVAGNGGTIVADGGPMHGFDASCAIVIPANSVVVFARAS